MSRSTGIFTGLIVLSCCNRLVCKITVWILLEKCQWILYIRRPRSVVASSAEVAHLKVPMR